MPCLETACPGAAHSDGEGVLSDRQGVRLQVKQTLPPLDYPLVSKERHGIHF